MYVQQNPKCGIQRIRNLFILNFKKYEPKKPLNTLLFEIPVFSMMFYGT